MRSTGKRKGPRDRIPPTLILLTVALAGIATIPTSLIGGTEAVAMMGVGAGAALLTVLGGYYCVQLAIRGPDRFAVKLVVGGFLIRLVLLMLTLVALVALTGIEPSRFVLWLVGFYIALVMAEAAILARESMSASGEETR
jgi:hypothetical protein